MRASQLEEQAVRKQRPSPSNTELQRLRNKLRVSLDEYGAELAHLAQLKAIRNSPSIQGVTACVTLWDKVIQARTNDRQGKV